MDSEGQLKAAADKLVDSFRVRSASYPSNLLMWPWGHDFQFTQAHLMFDTMDKILDYINTHDYDVRAPSSAELRQEADWVTD